jgi:hypothetical protein
LERIILRCLAKEPDDRWCDVDALDRALSRCEHAGLWTEDKAAEWWDRENHLRSIAENRCAGTEPDTVTLEWTTSFDRSLSPMAARAVA